ncbi:MAG: TonB-dependent receptor [Pseudomonadota bacterium]
MKAENKWVKSTIVATALAVLPLEYVYADLEEIIVTARKRVETLQEVPVSVTAVSGDLFEQYGGSAAKDLAEMTSNLNVSRGSVSQNISIRGLGTFISTGGFASAVGLGIDGLFFSQLPWLEVGMFDMQQVEVLRGPQGTYFGKNTTAGLINVVSRSPSEELEGHFTVGYESELEALRLEAGVGGALADNLRARIAVQHLEDDGWMENAATGEAVEAAERDIVKLSFDWDITDNVQLFSRTSYSDWALDGNAVQLGNCGPGGPIPLLPSLPTMVEDCVVDDKKTGGLQRDGFDADIQGLIDAGNVVLGTFGAPYVNRSGVVNGRNDYRDIETFSHSFGLVWDVGENSQLISVTGYATLELDYAVDSDFFDSSLIELGGMPPTIRIGFGQLLGFSNFEEYTQFTQELRFESRVGDSLSYVLGAYYEDSETDLLDLTDFSIDQFGFYASRDKRSRFDNDSWALFGELAWELSDAWRLILGGRYTDESADASTVAEVGSLGDPFDDDFLAQLLLGSVGISELDLNDERNSTNFSPSAVLQWQASDQGVLYLSYKEGFKSGGFDGSVSGPLSIPFYEFDDETAESIELGAKWETSSWRVNAALFQTEYEDLQVQVFDGTLATVTRNAASATTQGFEVDSLWAATDSLTVTLGLGYTNAEYDDFQGASCYTSQTEAQGCVAGFQDLSGGDLQLAPKWSANLGLNWVRDLAAGLQLQLGATVNYRDDVWLSTTLDPESLEDSLTLLNVNASLSGADGHWTLAFIGRNVSDEEYRTSFADIPFHDAHQIRLGQPSTYELQFTYRFF